MNEFDDNLSNETGQETGDAFVFPTSFGQRRLWFLDQLEPGSAAYNITIATRITGELHEAALQKALDTLVERHESLRTTFDLEDDEPVQIVEEHGKITLDIADLNGTNEDALQYHLKQLASMSFDLLKGPLLRVHLLKVSDNTSVLFLNIHHIIADAWSLGILYRELVTCYEAEIAGTDAGLPELEIQYGDFAEWQQDWLQSDEVRNQLGYWETQLADAPPVLDLPTDHPRPRIQTHNGAIKSRLLPADIAAGLTKLAQTQSCTPFILLLAAYDVLLARYAGTTDVIVGTPIAGRSRRELEPLIGFFLNTIALRADLSGNPSFIDFLQQVKERSLSAYANQDLPFEKLVEEIQPERNMSYSPVFQALFVLEHAVTEGAPFSQLKAEPQTVKSDNAKFDISLFVTEGSGAMNCTIEYNTDLFDAATIERMLVHFETLVTGIVANPDTGVADLPLLADTESTRVLTEFNATATDFGTLPVVHARVESQAAKTPDAVAVQNTIDSLTYAELNNRANVLAHRLIESGAGRGSLVAISCERSIDMAVATLAVLKSGAAYVPIDPNYPAERIEYMLGDAAPAVVLSQTAIALPAGTPRIDLDTFNFTDGNSSNPDAGVTGDDALYTIYTSGSTGLPKGVVLSHEGLSNLIEWQQTQGTLGQAARTLQFASLSFDVSFQELFTTWSQGGTLVMISEALRKDLPALAGFISEQQIGRLYMPYAALQPLADILHDRSDLPLALQDVISAGEQLQITDSMRQLFTRCGARLHNQYGPSETHVVTALTLATDPGNWPALPTIGTPVANTRCYILDTQGKPVPEGIPGELHLAGVQVAKEYLNRAELTQEKIVSDPFVSGSRMYRTGDRARYRSNGEIEFLGRVDDQVKFRGFRIEPGEIEAALTEHPLVQLAAVVIRDDGDKKLVAYTTVSGDIDSQTLRGYLKEQLPDYMVPTHFVILDEMPLTPSGKVARRKLPEPEWTRDATQTYVAPGTAAEQSLADIWSEVLGIKQVGINDDFFDLGGHSLLATQVISRLRNQLSVEIPLIKMFEDPTIASFAKHLDTAPVAADAVSGNVIPKRDKTLPAPLSFAQQRLWFLEQLDPGNPAYNFPIANRFNGKLDRQALQQALQQLIARHESLRTRFRLHDRKPVQEIIEHCDIEIEILDERNTAKPDLDRKLTELSQLPFDLNNAPLFRAHLIELSDDDEHILLLGTHHIVSDGWSLSVLFNDFTRYYNSAAAGTAAELSELPVQYADFAVWQQEWLRDEELERQLNFWREHLEGAEPVLDLPTDKPRPAEQTYRGAGVVRDLAPATTEGIRKLVSGSRSTLFMTLLAAFNVLLARYARQDHVVIGTPIAGRKHPELENLIGFFSNTLALHTDLSANPTFNELLGQIKASTLAAYDHQDLPFEKLVEELRPERDMSHSPIFQTMFVLQNTPEGDGRFDDIEVSAVNFEMGITKFDLLLEARESANGMHIGLQYNTDLFVEQTIQGMLDHFETLINNIVAAPDLPLSQLQLTGDAERHQVLQKFNSTSVDYGSDNFSAMTPQALTEAQAAATPDATAIEFEGERLSYRELNEQANRLANELIGRGIKPGDFVGLCCNRSIEALTALLAILKSGAAYIPLDPDYPSERLSYMISNSRLSLLLTENSVAATLPAGDTPTLLLNSFDWHSGNGDNPNVQTRATDPLYAIYTSGSTGNPKGAVLPQESLSNLINWQIRRPGFEHAARTLQYASLSFDVHHQEIFSTWATGGTLILITQEMRQDLQALVRFISEQNVQRLWMPFAALQPTAEIMAQRDDLEFSLEQMCTSGEQLQVTPLIRALFSKYPHIGFHNEYGPSEAHVVSVYSFSPGAERWPALPPIGKAVPNTQLYILDPEQQPCPVGVPGELYISGNQVGSGYLNQAEQSQEKFTDNPFKPGTRIYRSGDLARFMPDGNIAYLGRTDDQVKYRGFRIEPGEIEAYLASLAGVRLAAVVLREDSPGDKRLIGYVTPEPGQDLDVKAVKSACQEHLPEYMVPSQLVLLDEMPVTPSGKISRRLLPVPERSDQSNEYIAPRNDVETALAGLWQEVLGTERIGVLDDFFELGGHSLLATQLISRIRDAFGIELPLKYVFRNSTVEALGEQISALQLMQPNDSDNQTHDDQDNGPDDEDMEEFQI